MKCPGFNSQKIASSLKALANVEERQPELVVRLCREAGSGCQYVKSYGIK